MIAHEETPDPGHTPWIISPDGFHCASTSFLTLGAVVVDVIGVL